MEEGGVDSFVLDGSVGKSAITRGVEVQRRILSLNLKADSSEFSRKPFLGSVIFRTLSEDFFQKYYHLEVVLLKFDLFSALKASLHGSVFLTLFVIVIFRV